jgi:hypothetical protein
VRACGWRRRLSFREAFRDAARASRNPLCASAARRAPGGVAPGAPARVAFCAARKWVRPPGAIRATCPGTQWLYYCRLRASRSRTHEWASSLIRSLTRARKVRSVAFALLWTTYGEFGSLQWLMFFACQGSRNRGGGRPTVSCYSASDAQLLECPEEEARRSLGSAYLLGWA